MFTMPLWTALLAYVLIGQKWRPHDVLLALSCLAGVTLVTELWDSDAGVAGKSRTQWIGKPHTQSCSPSAYPSQEKFARNSRVGFC